MTTTNGAHVKVRIGGIKGATVCGRDPELAVEDALHIDIVHDATGWYAFDNVVPMWGEGDSAAAAVGDLVKSLVEFRQLHHDRKAPHIAEQLRYIGRVL